MMQWPDYHSLKMMKFNLESGEEGKEKKVKEM